MIKKIFASVMVIFFCASLAVAADQTRKRDRKKDGSCETSLIKQDVGQLIAADRTKKRDRKKDGSCES